MFNWFLLFVFFIMVYRFLNLLDWVNKVQYEINEIEDDVTMITEGI